MARHDGRECHVSNQRILFIVWQRFPQSTLDSKRNDLKTIVDCENCPDRITSYFAKLLIA